MDVFQTPVFPELSPLEESEEQFEAFFCKSGMCFFFFFCAMRFHSFTSCLPLLTSPRNCKVKSFLSRCRVKEQLLNLIMNLLTSF